MWLRWAPATLAEQPQNIILMGWDGCHRDHVEALLKEDNLPNTKNLIAEGTGSHVEGSGIMNHTTPIRTALLLLASCALCAGESQVQYQPTRESLSQHRVPEWYQDAKIGFFYHGGPQSVAGDKFDKDALLFCRAQGKYAGMHVKNPPGQWGGHHVSQAREAGEGAEWRLSSA